MKLSTLINATPSLQALGATKLPARAAYRIAKCLNMIQPELALYDEQRLKIAAEFGTKSEDGTRFEFINGNAEKFSANLQTLLDEEVAITLPSISPDDLGDATIEPHHLAALDGVVIVEAP